MRQPLLPLEDDHPLNRTVLSDEELTGMGRDQLLEAYGIATIFMHQNHSGFLEKNFTGLRDEALKRMEPRDD